MYIDENLIRILTPHKGETIDVSYAISLIKTIAKEYEEKQLLLHNVSQQRELMYAVCDKLAEAIHKHPLPPSLKSAIINDVLADNCG